MIVGTVSADGVPAVRLPVAGQDWLAVIDTGFNGDLELPDVLRASLNPRFVARISSLLAGGQTVDEDCYRVEFPFDGETIAANVTFVVGGEILVGTHLLRRHKLNIHFPAATVQCSV